MKTLSLRTLLLTLPLSALAFTACGERTEVKETTVIEREVPAPAPAPQQAPAEDDGGYGGRIGDKIDRRADEKINEAIDSF